MNIKKLKTKNNLIILGILLILLLQSTLNLVDDIDIGSVLGTTSPWVQTDWSGGAQGGTVDTTVNTYESKSQINAQITGNVTLDLISGWSSEYQSWSYRKKISFDNTQVKLGVTPTALADYPLLVKLNSGNINYNHTKDAGEDIRFTDSDGTLLAYEIENGTRPETAMSG